jgi:hypothetical protein
MRRSVVAVVVAAAAVARADTVNVKVIEVAGGVAFVDAGRARGLAPRTAIRIGDRSFAVFEVTEKTAAFRIGGAKVAIGDAGTATVTPNTTGGALPKPRPAEAFVGQWPAPVLPADTAREVAPVPLDVGAARGRARVTVIASGYGTIDKSTRAGDGEARVVATFDLLRERPLAADVDVAGRAFSAGADSGTHVPLFVRAAELRYGGADDPRFAIGRLRYAATSVGMLDGGRASARFGAFELAAWGGLVPDPLGATPSTSAARFGAEFIYSAADAAWQPRVAVNAHGSTYNGALDERRVSAVASAGKDAIWTSAWLEAQQFDTNNPWGAPSVQLTGLGATVEYRKRGAYLSFDGTFLRPDRSLLLDAVLGRSWTCSLSGGPAMQETCTGDDYIATATLAGGVRRGVWALDGVATLGETHEIYSGITGSGYLRGELHATAPLRFEAGISAGKASFASWTAAEVGAGFAWTKRLDLQLRYRPERLVYDAPATTFVEHSLIGDARYAAAAALDLVATVIAATGGDRDNVALLVTAVWRPLR